MSCFFFIIFEGCALLNASIVSFEDSAYKIGEFDRGAKCIWDKQHRFFLYEAKNIVKINSSGRVAANSDHGGFIWDENYGWINLGNFEGGLQITDMNDSGMVIGYSRLKPYHDRNGKTQQDIQGFVWKDGIMYDFSNMSFKVNKRI
ncbi:MAG TPA: hypothetical protein VL443_29870 [Cyclobacteriaceae bacterium]|jgi:hypothetical protein|nr:hypothetical protein [Cyclobacteriaceae bacterium]